MRRRIEPKPVRVGGRDPKADKKKRPTSGSGASRTETKARRKPRQAPPGPGLIGRAVRGVFRLIWGFTWRLGLVMALVVGAATGYYYSILPPSDQLFDGRGSGSVRLFDASGQIFAWRGEQYGGDLTIDQASPHLIDAVIAVEDKRFHNHIGIDPRGIARALYENFKAGRLVQGGSTITQQVAKNVFLDARRKLERKIKEVPMALALELKYSKDEILSVYLNRVYLGAGTFGFEAAAQRYFGKSAKVLTIAEAAMLAGLLRAPSALAPTNDLSRSQDRAATIVGLMRDQHRITLDQAEAALARPAVLSEAAAARAGGAFADWLMDRGGEDRFLKLLEGADIEIETTFDARIQSIAERALADVFDRKVKAGSKAQAAIVVMRPDGAVVAMVGGREKGAAQFNRATQAQRQPGSAFKPIVFAAALEAGVKPNDVVEDRPITIKGWSPGNYTGKYVGSVTVTEALKRSINTVAVRLSEQAGRDKVRAMAERMGLSNPIAPGPAVALGTAEARLIEMTGVYAVIANGGRAVVPHGVRAIRLRGDKDPIDRGPQGPGEQVISKKTAGLLTYMMREVVNSGTGKRARLPGWDVAGKTGTTQRARDAWFLGFTAEYVVGVWMGYDDNVPLTGVTGGGLPAEIWQVLMARLHEGLSPRPLNIVVPEAQVVLAPPERTERTETRSTSDAVAEEVLRDVVDSLRGDVKPAGEQYYPGNDL